MGADIIITLIFGLLDRAQAYATLIAKAKAENRDVTEAEVDAAVAEYDASRASLVAAIARARAAEAAK